MTAANETTYRHILLDRDGPVATVTMNRPEKRNALSAEHMLELRDAFRALGGEPEVGAIVLRANGPAFCAGHDLAEMVGREPAFHRGLFDLCIDLMTVIQAIPQPVIAQVHAIATAAGCQLVATCDLAVAAEEARFATPGVKIGLFCSTPMVALSRAVSRKTAMKMLLTGEPLSAQQALAAGLVNDVVPAAQLASATRALADKVCASSAYVVGLGKRAFYQQLEMPQPLAYQYARDVMVQNACAADAQEGMGAFLGKRAPEWKNR